MLAVGLLVLEDDLFADAPRDGMPLFDDPEDLLVAGLAPFQLAGGGPHQGAEDLRGVAGVEHDHAHACHDVHIDPLHDGVRHVPVTHMPPPEEDVGVVEDFVRQAAFGVVEGGGADLVARVAQKGRDRLMDAVRVDRLDGGIGFFVREFVPDCDFHA